MKPVAAFFAVATMFGLCIEAGNYPLAIAAAVALAAVVVLTLKNIGHEKAR